MKHESNQADTHDNPDTQLRLKVYRRNLVLTSSQDQVEVLNGAATMLDHTMNEMNAGPTKEVMSVESRALYAGIKLAAELIQARQDDKHIALISHRIMEMNERIERHLKEQQEMADS